MNNESDPKLAQLFGQIREPLAGEQFVKTVSIQIGRARRMRNLAMTAFWLVSIIALIAITPWFGEGSVMLARSFDLALPYCSTLMTSPTGWVFSGILALLIYRRARRLA
jgi:energy-converting hydrogenase Eha subunit H